MNGHDATPPHDVPEPRRPEDEESREILARIQRLGVELAWIIRVYGTLVGEPEE